jgi:hypothetical protein
MSLEFVMEEAEMAFKQEVFLQNKPRVAETAHSLRRESITIVEGTVEHEKGLMPTE